MILQLFRFMLYQPDITHSVLVCDFRLDFSEILDCAFGFFGVSLFCLDTIEYKPSLCEECLVKLSLPHWIDIIFLQ